MALVSTSLITGPSAPGPTKGREGSKPSTLTPPTEALSVQVNEANIVNAFRSLLSANPRTKDYDLDDSVCLKFLRSRDYDLRESVKVLAGFISILKERPDIFSWSDSIEKVISSGMYYHYPVKTPTGSKLLVIHPGKWDTRAFKIETIITTTLFFDEVSMFDQEVQREGFIGIVDMRGLGWSHIYNVGISNAKLASDLTDKYIPFKLINLHVIYENKLTDLAYSLFKPFLDEKLKNRIIFHGHDLSSLYSYVPRDCLPPSLGGTNIEYSIDSYFQRLKVNRDRVLDVWKALQKKRKTID